MLQALTMETKIMKVTPALARRWLQGNIGNRRLSKALVRQYARAMKAGHWSLTHQGIALAPSGRLLDGQHRLHGVIEADVTIEMMVTFNATEASYAHMDAGGKRRLRDRCSLEDSRAVDVCAWIARLFGIGAPQAHEIHTIAEAGIEHAMIDLLAAAGSTAKGRTAAPIRAAAALRYVQGHADYVREQYRALVDLDFPAMTPAMQAFYRQMADEPPGGGSTMQNHRAARAWIAFDPARAEISRIVLRDLPACMAEMRSVLRVAF